MEEICFYTTNVAFFESDRELQMLLDSVSGVLADVRPLTLATTAGANYEAWQSSAGLQQHFGRRYRRVAPLANRGGANALIHHLALGIRIIESWGQNVILLCDCPTAIDADCHRHHIARELRRKKYWVEEIDAEQTAACRAASQPTSKAAVIEKKAIKPSLRHLPPPSTGGVRRPPPTSPFESGVVTLVCGIPEDLERFDITAEIAGGLAIHPVIHAQTEIGEYAVTHVATGRQICRAATEKAAKYLATRFLALDADWVQEVPWRSEAQAEQIKAEVGVILRRMNED